MAGTPGAMKAYPTVTGATVATSVDPTVVADLVSSLQKAGITASSAQFYASNLDTTTLATNADTAITGAGFKFGLPVGNKPLALPGAPAGAAPTIGLYSTSAMATGTMMAGTPGATMSGTMAGTMSSGTMSGTMAGGTMMAGTPGAMMSVTPASLAGSDLLLLIAPVPTDASSGGTVFDLLGLSATDKQTLLNGLKGSRSAMILVSGSNLSTGVLKLVTTLAPGVLPG